MWRTLRTIPQNANERYCTAHSHFCLGGVRLFQALAIALGSTAIALGISAFGYG